MLTFRTSITCAVIAFIVAPATLLIAIQARALHWATNDAASAYMDATSTKAIGRLHVGEAVVGNLGSSERMNYTALGDTVNLAARLEGLNKQFGTVILVSEAVYLRVQHCFRFRAFESVIAKGMTKQTRVFELVGASA